VIFDCFARCAVTGPTGAIETEGAFPDCPHPLASRKNKQTIFETRFGEIIRETPASPIQILVALAFAFYCQFWGFDAGSPTAELPSLHKLFALDKR
jgi:hypothetical protein